MRGDESVVGVLYTLVLRFSTTSTWPAFGIGLYERHRPDSGEGGRGWRV